jgi:hypothetical protein
MRAPFWIAVAMLVGVASGAEPTDTQIIAAHLDAVLTTIPSAEIAEHRDKCITGAQAEAVAMAREVGLPGYADAADLCFAVLIRTARDGRLLDAYAKIVADNGGDATRVETLPDAVGGALLKQKSTDVPIGNGLAVGIKPAVAFDAGFSVAYRAGDRDLSGLPGTDDLKETSEACLAQRASDMGQCFWAGYALGAKSLNGHVPPLTGE